MSSQLRDAQLRPTTSPDPVILQDFQAEARRGVKKSTETDFIFVNELLSK
jgi:hypothetical protein